MEIVILTVIFLANLIAIFLYKKVAIKKGILANPNFRTLHESPIPRGGGIVFSMIFSVSVFFLWMINQLPNDLLLILGFGGLVAALIGFIDDIFDIKASIKLFLQLFLSVWILFWFDGGPLINVSWIPFILTIPLSSMVPLQLYLYL